MHAQARQRQRSFAGRYLGEPVPSHSREQPEGGMGKTNTRVGSSQSLLCTLDHEGDEAIGHHHGEATKCSPTSVSAHRP